MPAPALSYLKCSDQLEQAVTAVGTVKIKTLQNKRNLRYYSVDMSTPLVRYRASTESAIHMQGISAKLPQAINNWEQIPAAAVTYPPTHPTEKQSNLLT